MDRYLSPHIKSDLDRKMVFLGGPRQVGKTTLCKRLLGSNLNYYSWDIDADRTDILAKTFAKKGLLVFDELHKYRRWRNYLKGIYDGKDEKLKILVTGSARLDLYRYGGESLQGRYHYWHLLPLSVRELSIVKQQDLIDLYTLGGFPEPYLSGSERTAKRWSKEYRVRLVRDEVRSLEDVKDLATLEILYGHIPNTVGSPLSINSLRELVQINHMTAKRWLDIYERLYGMFRLAPFGSQKIRAVKKEQKAYLYDWTIIPDEGARFENFIAMHLLKYVYFLCDSEGENLELRYYRDTTPREVDFVIVKNGKAIRAIECKLADPSISSGLRYFKSKHPDCQCEQVLLNCKKEYVSPEGISVRSALTLLGELV